MFQVIVVLVIGRIADGDLHDTDDVMHRPADHSRCVGFNLRQALRAVRKKAVKKTLGANGLLSSEEVNTHGRKR